jgi:hypothetical protein
METVFKYAPLVSASCALFMLFWNVVPPIWSGITKGKTIWAAVAGVTWRRQAAIMMVFVILAWVPTIVSWLNEHQPAEALSFNDIAPLSTTPDIKRDFNAEYAEHSSEFGGRLDAIRPGNPSYYQAWHERALVIWIGAPRTLFCVVSWDSAHKSFCEDDLDGDVPDSYFGNSPEFRSKFKDLPADKLPPYAGFARRWLRDPVKWSWIGYVNKECTFSGPSYYWSLSKGRVIGIFRLKPEDSWGQIISIFDDGTASARNTVKAPACLQSRMADRTAN